MDTKLVSLITNAEQGDVAAQYDLGNMYANGAGGVRKTAAEAVKWYTRAAGQGHADAQKKLGLMYEIGDGVPKNGVEAVKWYTIAAEKGHAGAQFSLGFVYYAGEGVPKDAVKALKWFARAAEQGNTGAQNYVGALRRNTGD